MRVNFTRKHDIFNVFAYRIDTQFITVYIPQNDTRFPLDDCLITLDGCLIWLNFYQMAARFHYTQQ
jgi:hypothetical protein